MSETIKAVFVNYIACALLGGILEYIVPGRMKKTLRGIIVAVMLAASLSPVLKIDFQLPETASPSEMNENMNYTALMHTAKLTEKKVYNDVRDILINMGIDEYEIYVKTTVEEAENTVYLDGVKIEVDKSFVDRIPEIQMVIPVEYSSITVVDTIAEEDEG